MDLQDISSVIRSNLFTVIAVPLIAALIGWVTNYVAVKMIFRPRRPRRILGIRIQGLIPRRQSDLAASIGETVQRDLVTHKDVQDALSGADIEAEMRKFAGEQIDNFINKILADNPMISMFIPAGKTEQIKERLVHQMTDLVPEFLEKIMRRVEDSLDFKEIVQKRIESFDLSKLEEIIYRISSQELKTIEILGGVLGFFVGLVQVALMIAAQ